jgi:hypothetical protein
MLTAHICSWRRTYDGSSHPMFAAWADGIYPELRAAAVAAVEADDVKLHDYASAVTSSQAFALNLFLPFREGRRDTLAARLAPCLGTPFVIDRIALEWVPPGALLGEIDGDRPRPGEGATAADVVLWGHLLDDPPAAVPRSVPRSGAGGHCDARMVRPLRSRRQPGRGRALGILARTPPRSREAPVLPASAVLAAGRDAGCEAWAGWMSDRYRLRTPAVGRIG